MYYMGTWSLRVPGVIGCQACAERGSKAAGSKASEGAASQNFVPSSRATAWRPGSKT